MAWFTYKCETDGEFKMSLIKRLKEAKCPKCNSLSKPILKAGTSQVLEKLDNGAMVRAVERLDDIETIMKERNDKNRVNTNNGLKDDQSC